MSKKILRAVFCLMLVTLFSIATMVSAAQPRWAELATYQCALSTKNGLFSNANVAATASTHNAYSNLELIVTVQLWNGSEYKDTSNVWSSTGIGATSIDRNIMLGFGNYRAKAVVKVCSSSGTYIETITRYSDSIIV